MCRDELWFYFCASRSRAFLKCNLSFLEKQCVGLQTLLRVCSRGRVFKSFVWLDKLSTSTSVSCLIKMTAREIKNNRRTVGRLDENMMTKVARDMGEQTLRSLTATSLVFRALTFPRMMFSNGKKQIRRIARRWFRFRFDCARERCGNRNWKFYSSANQNEFRIAAKAMHHQNATETSFVVWRDFHL